MYIYLPVNYSEYPTRINIIILPLWNNTAFQLLCDESMNSLYYNSSYDISISITTPLTLYQ